MEYLGAWGTLIHEKNLKSKISCQTPFNLTLNMLGITPSYTKCASNYIELVLIMRQNQVYLIQSISLNSGLFRECTG
jgi:hypothetical protein